MTIFLNLKCMYSRVRSIKAAAFVVTLGWNNPDVNPLMTRPMRHGAFCRENECILATSDCMLDPEENCKILRVQVSVHAEVSSGLRSHDRGLLGWAQVGWDSEAAVLFLNPGAGDIKRVPCADSVSGERYPYVSTFSWICLVLH